MPLTLQRHAALLQRRPQSLLPLLFITPAHRSMSTDTPPSTYRTFQPHLNYRQLRIDPDILRTNIKSRRISHIDMDAIIKLNDNVTRSEFAVAELRKRRNQIAADMALLIKKQTLLRRNAHPKAEMDACDVDRIQLIQEGKVIKHNVQVSEEALLQQHRRLFEAARHLPNDVHKSVPVGDESCAELLATYGSPSTQPMDSESTASMSDLSHDAPPFRTHLDLAAMHDMLDIDRAGKVSGSRFYYLKNAGAMLEMALTRYAMDMCLQRGFMPVLVPDIIRHEVVEACGFSPRSDDPQTYYVSSHVPREPDAVDPSHPPVGSDHTPLCLAAATAEFPLAGMYAGETLLSLPMKMAGMGRAFRAEGLSGSTNRGLYRVHQFTKVELFALTRPGKHGYIQSIH
ncbi:hypothetical protein BASA83_011466 [Batrachochytrium salamandrivorans]|nr:hypothetical protein BASA83_011466 [Batrachochytrium salamandrivorans]